MEAENVPELEINRQSKGRIVAGFTFALSIALSAFFLINSSASYNVAFGSLWFLAILPAYLCALICYIGDRDRTRPRYFYYLVPPIFGTIVTLGSIIFLHEGAICIAMLAPVWLLFGWLGAFTLRRHRSRADDGVVLHSTLLLLPLLSGMIETQVPVPHDYVTLTRTTVVNATPAEIWPFAVSNAHISEKEGHWTFSQNILGLPRPRATTITGKYAGAVRTAYWGDNINFEERVTEWQPGRRLGWSFAFTNDTLQNYTDKHIAPDGDFLKVDTGDYTLTPLDANRTQITLRTRYIAKTHVNAYAKLWGEIILGDVQGNVLEILKNRAEKVHKQI